MKGGYSNMILNFIRGFCMALADSVPGVSGGTVAFLLGFYDKFIGSLDALVAGSMQEKKEAIIFLIKIMVGWVVGFLMAFLRVSLMLKFIKLVLCLWALSFLPFRLLLKRKEQI